MRWSVVGTVCLALPMLTEPTGLAAKKRSPVATGAYEILLGGRRIGEEKFSVFQEKKKLVVESTATLYWPEPTRHQYRHELVSSFQTKKLTFNLIRSGITSTMELKPHRENWRLEIKGKGRKKFRQELGRKTEAEIDFGSLLFKSFILKRLSLNPGDERTVDVIALQLPDLNGRRNRQTYRRLEDEDMASKLDKAVRASVYELVASETIHRLWAGPSGFVLKAHFDSPVGVYEYDLVQLDSSWQFVPQR
jgi:hypothetical protein